MEVETFAEQLNQRILEKTQDSPIYRKASGVLQSLMQAGTQLPNFQTDIIANPKTAAFYLTAGTYKLLRKIIEGDQKLEHQTDAFLLLLSMTLPEASPEALVKAGILRDLRKYTLAILKRKDLSPLMTRLAVSVLSYSFAPEMTVTNFNQGEEKQLILDLFDRSVAMPRSNALSRQCSKLLTTLTKNNSSVSSAIAEEAKANLLTNLEERRELYLSNVKQVILELPVRLVNDICFKLASTLADIDMTDTTQEHYLAQTYAFLQNMTSKLLSSTLEDMILILVNAIPAGTMPEKVQISYLQLLYESIIALVHSSEHSCNRVISPVISVLLEMLLVNPKIAKFASNQLSFIINNCIRPSLWRKAYNELDLEGIDLDDKAQEFTKVLCLFQSLLSSRFNDKKTVAHLVSLFIDQLDEATLDASLSLVHRLVEYRGELDEKKFRKVMESAVLTYGVENILKLYPLSLKGDIASESFEQENNLWMLTIIEKTDRGQQMTIFNQHLAPLLETARVCAGNQLLSKQKREGYSMIEELIWRCLRPFTKIIDPRINYEEVLLTIEKELSRVSEATLCQLAIALDHLCAILSPQNYKSKAAEQLIKTLASILTMAKGSSKQILKAIQGLAKISSPDYVKRVFDKNIEKLIGLGEAGTLREEQQKNAKNLEILMSVNSAINIQDPSVTTKYRISREELILKLVAVLIKLSGTFQKKGYKYLSEVLSAAPKSFFLEILELFEDNLKVDNGSKHYRLSVISKLWAWLKAGGLDQNLESLISFIKTHLPEILLALREQNKSVRDEALRMVGEFADSMEQLGLLDSFIETVCAGFVAERSEMKLATLSGMAVILSKGLCSQGMFKDVLQLVLLLLQQKRQQLYKGVVEYCKRSILSLTPSQQKQYLPTVIKLLFEEDEEGKMENRSILRHFLIKLTKKHGKDEIQAMIPQQHRKMLSHTLKMENREKRKKKELKIARRKQYEEQNKKKQDDDDSSESSEQEERQEAVLNDMEVEEPLEQLDNTNNLLLKYDLDKQQFHFQREHRGKPLIDKKHEAPTDEITFDSNGFMIIEERKRARVPHEQEEEDQQGQKIVDQPLNFKKKNKVEIHHVKESGDTFKTNRAGGDLKLKDKPEPYAFIQFNSKALNKRFKKRAQKVFDNLFERKEGGLKGLKSRLAKKH